VGPRRPRYPNQLARSRRSLRGLVRGGVLKGVLAQVRKFEASAPMRVPKTPRLRPGVNIVNARVVPAPAEIISLRVFRLSHHYVQIFLFS
jgi:hypothetical protein